MQVNLVFGTTMQALEALGRGPSQHECASSTHWIVGLFSASTDLDVLTSPCSSTFRSLYTDYATPPKRVHTCILQDKYTASIGSCAVYGVCVRPLHFWDCGFECSRGHGNMFLAVVSLSRYSPLWRAEHSFRGVLESVCVSRVWSIATITHHTYNWIGRRNTTRTERQK
jgi:hypothetical protein